MYARNDTRTPALVNVGVAMAGAMRMVVAFNAVHGTLRVPALALAHSIAYSGGAVVLYLLARGGLPGRCSAHVARSVPCRSAARCSPACVMWAIGRVADPGQPDGALGVMVVAAGHRHVGVRHGDRRCSAVPGPGDIVGAAEGGGRG